MWDAPFPAHTMMVVKRVQLGLTWRCSECSEIQDVRAGYAKRREEAADILAAFRIVDSD